MNTESLKRHLATVVNGWDYGAQNYLYWVGNENEGTQFVIPQTDFDPLNNIEQAMGLRLHFSEWTINEVYVEVLSKSLQEYCMVEYGVGRDVKTLEEAISLTCARASGWEE